jgi:hypothetical protein
MPPISEDVTLLYFSVVSVLVAFASVKGPTVVLLRFNKQLHHTMHSPIASSQRLLWTKNARNTEVDLFDGMVSLEREWSGY